MVEGTAMDVQMEVQIWLMDSLQAGIQSLSY